MKRLLPFLLLLLGCSPAWATITSTQIKANCTVVSTGGTCAFAAAVTAGHAIVITVANTTGQALTSVTMTGETFTVPAGCHADDALAGTTDCAYTLSAAGGQTTATFNFTGGSNSLQPTMYEFSFTNGPLSIDQSTTAIDASSTTLAGVTFTLTGTNDALFQWVSCQQTCGATYSTANSYTLDANTSGDNFGHLYNSAQTSGPTSSSSPAGKGTYGGLAIKEAAAAGGTTGFNKEKKQELMEQII